MPGRCLRTVEEQILGEPDALQVSWLGSAAGTDVLAVVDKVGLTKWRDALDACGIHEYEVHCETLVLPWTTGNGVSRGMVVKDSCALESSTGDDECRVPTRLLRRCRCA
jgi:hypothetical protein